LRSKPKLLRKISWTKFWLWRWF